MEVDTNQPIRFTFKDNRGKVNATQKVTKTPEEVERETREFHAKIDKLFVNATSTIASLPQLTGTEERKTKEDVESGLNEPLIPVEQQTLNINNKGEHAISDILNQLPTDTFETTNGTAQQLNKTTQFVPTDQPLAADGSLPQASVAAKSERDIVSKSHQPIPGPRSLLCWHNVSIYYVSFQFVLSAPPKWLR
jgi:hypothetical protein